MKKIIFLKFEFFLNSTFNFSHIGFMLISYNFNLQWLILLGFLTVPSFSTGFTTFMIKFEFFIKKKNFIKELIFFGGGRVGVKGSWRDHGIE